MPNSNTARKWAKFLSYFYLTKLSSLWLQRITHDRPPAHVFFIIDIMLFSFSFRADFDACERERWWKSLDFMLMWMPEEVKIHFTPLHLWWWFLRSLHQRSKRVKMMTEHFIAGTAHIQPIRIFIERFYDFWVKWIEPNLCGTSCTTFLCVSLRCVDF